MLLSRASTSALRAASSLPSRQPCTPTLVQHSSWYSDVPATSSSEWSVDRKGKGREVRTIGRQEPSAHLAAEYPADASSTSASKPSRSITARRPPVSQPAALLSDANTEEEAPRLFRQRQRRSTAIIEAALDSDRPVQSSWEAFSALPLDRRKELKPTFLGKLLNVQLSVVICAAETSDNTGAQAKEQVGLSEVWMRCGEILLALRSRGMDSETTDLLRRIGKEIILSEIRAQAADEASDARSALGSPSTTNVVRARYRALKTVEVYHFLLGQGVQPDAELYALVREAGRGLRHHSVPFPLLRSIAQRHLPVRFDARPALARPLVERTELEIHAKYSVLARASAEGLFRLAIEARDFETAKALYAHVRKQMRSQQQQAAPVVQRRPRRRLPASEGFLWDAQTTRTYFIDFFSAIADDALAFRPSRDRSHRNVSLKLAHSIYQDWRTDNTATNTTPREILIRLSKLLLGHEHQEQVKATWRLLVQDPAFIGSNTAIEILVRHMGHKAPQSAVPQLHHFFQKLFRANQGKMRLSVSVCERWLWTFAHHAALTEARAGYDEAWAYLTKRHRSSDLSAIPSTNAWNSRLERAAQLGHRPLLQEYLAIEKAAPLALSAYSLSYALPAAVALSKFKLVKLLLRRAREKGQSIFAIDLRATMLALLENGSPRDEVLSMLDTWEADVLEKDRNENAPKVLALARKETLAWKAEQGQEVRFTDESRQAHASQDAAAASTLDLTSAPLPLAEPIREDPDRTPIPVHTSQVKAESALPPVQLKANEEPGRPAEEGHRDLGLPFLQAFFTSNAQSVGLTLEESEKTAATVAPHPEITLSAPVPVRSTSRPVREEQDQAPCGMSAQSSPYAYEGFSFPALSLSQAAPTLHTRSQASSFGYSAPNPWGSPYRKLHLGNTLDAMLEIAEKARAQLEAHAASLRQVQLANSRERAMSHADMARWSGWREHAATPWY